MAVPLFRRSLSVVVLSILFAALPVAAPRGAAADSGWDPRSRANRPGGREVARTRVRAPGTRRLPQRCRVQQEHRGHARHDAGRRQGRAPSRAVPTSFDRSAPRRRRPDRRRSRRCRPRARSPSTTRRRNGPPCAARRSTAPRRSTLAHELTHALQDQHFDLTKLQKAATRSHSSGALRALVEGDARRVQLLYARPAVERRTPAVRVVPDLGCGSSAGGDARRRRARFAHRVVPEPVHARAARCSTSCRRPTASRRSTGCSATRPEPTPPSSPRGRWSTTASSPRSPRRSWRLARPPRASRTCSVPSCST